MLLHWRGARYIRASPFSDYARRGNSVRADRYSRAILGELQRDSRLTVQQIAAAVGLSSKPCWKRIKDIKAAGVMRGCTARVEAIKACEPCLHDTIFKLPGVTPVSSRIVLREVKADAA